MAESKKGSASTELTIGKAAAKLQAGITSLKGVVEEITQLEQRSSDLAIDIAGKEDKLVQLDVEYTERLRSKQVELKLRVQADEAEVANKYAENAGKEIVDKKVREREQQELAELNENFEEKVAKQVQAATSSMTANHRNELALKESEFKAREATNTATIESQKIIIANQERQIAMLTKQLDDERAASIARAQGQAAPTINVGQGR